jgi:hypothetical protein
MENISDRHQLGTVQNSNSERHDASAVEYK